MERCFIRPIRWGGFVLIVASFTTAVQRMDAQPALRPGLPVRPSVPTRPAPQASGFQPSSNASANNTQPPAWTNNFPANDNSFTSGGFNPSPGLQMAYSAYAANVRANNWYAWNYANNANWNYWNNGNFNANPWLMPGMPVSNWAPSWNTYLNISTVNPNQNVFFTTPAWNNTAPFWNPNAGGVNSPFGPGINNPYMNGGMVPGMGWNNANRFGNPKFGFNGGSGL